MGKHDVWQELIRNRSHRVKPGSGDAMMRRATEASQAWWPSHRPNTGKATREGHAKPEAGRRTECFDSFSRMQPQLAAELTPGLLEISSGPVGKRYARPIGSSLRLCSMCARD